MRFSYWDSIWPLLFKKAAILLIYEKNNVMVQKYSKHQIMYQNHFILCKRYHFIFKLKHTDSHSYPFIYICFHVRKALSKICDDSIIYWNRWLNIIYSKISENRVLLLKSFNLLIHPWHDRWYMNTSVSFIQIFSF